MSMIVAVASDGNVEQEANDEPSEAQIKIDGFWPSILEEMKKIKSIEPGNQILPLARIKKIMKLDEDVKMISAEAPLLFAKACEIFIRELTLRAWLHTDDNKRRTLQRNDIAMAISKYDQFDFLIDIVPRDEIKPKKEETPAAAAPPPTKASVYVTEQPSSSTAPQAAVAVSTPTSLPASSGSFQLCYPTQDAAALQAQQAIQSPQIIGQPMIIPVQAAHQSQMCIPQFNIVGGQPQAHQLQQQIQCILPTGEVAQIPLNFVRAQLGSQAATGSATPGQQVILQAHPQLNLAPTHLIPHAGQNQIFIQSPTGSQSTTPHPQTPTPVAGGQATVHQQATLQTSPQTVTANQGTGQ